MCGQVGMSQALPLSSVSLSPADSLTNARLPVEISCTWSKQVASWIWKAGPRVSRERTPQLFVWQQRPLPPLSGGSASLAHVGQGW